jgi:hypothetical protein
MSLWRAAAVLVLLLLGSPTPGQTVSEAQLKAVFLVNFAKFTTWPDLSPADPIILCTVGDDEVASSLALAVRRQTVGGRVLAASQLPRDAGWAPCQLLFLGYEGVSRVRLEAAPPAVLTVSDAEGFASNGGMIEFFMEGSRLRFAVNLREVDESRVRLSSNLLQLARIVGERRVR